MPLAHTKVRSNLNKNSSFLNRVETVITGRIIFSPDADTGNNVYYMHVVRVRVVGRSDVGGG